MNTTIQNNPVEKTRMDEMAQSIDLYRKGNETMTAPTQSPDYVGFSGVFKKQITIGASAKVFVQATVEDDEYTDLIVIYNGICIQDALNEQSFQEIKDTLNKDWAMLVQKAKQEATNTGDY